MVHGKVIESGTAQTISHRPETNVLVEPLLMNAAEAKRGPFPLNASWLLLVAGQGVPRLVSPTRS